MPTRDLPVSSYTAPTTTATQRLRAWCLASYCIAAAQVAFARGSKSHDQVVLERVSRQLRVATHLHFSENA